MKGNNGLAKCDSCGNYRQALITVKKLKYCYACEAMGVHAQRIKKDLKGKDLDKMVKDLLKAPPRKKTKDRS